MADYYLHKRDYDEWKVVVPSKKLGKHMGYCSGKTIDGYHCGLMFGELEIGKPCGRCGTILKAERINYG